MSKPDFDLLVERAKRCDICTAALPHTPRPIFQASPRSKIIIIGQAPGSKVHQSGIPWKDASGNRLRQWLQVDEQTFYDPDSFALLPLGFCYPGKGKSGDLPPRPECSPQWHPAFLSHLTESKVILLVGKHAQDYYLQGQLKGTLTETVKLHQIYLPKFFPLPHPSPRNNHWFTKNPWFETDVLPTLRTVIHSSLHV